MKYTIYGDYSNLLKIGKLTTVYKSGKSTDISNYRPISVLSALIELLSKICIDIDEKKIVSGLFLDLAKAFDSVDQQLLLKKLEYAGIRGVALDLFRSYLSIYQFVYANEIDSRLKITFRVPQGSV